MKQVNTDTLAFALLVADTLALVAGLVALVLTRIEDKDARMELLASLPLIGKPLEAIFKEPKS